MVRARPRKRNRAPADLGDEAAGEDGEEPSLFPVGAEVEVSSDDPGFAGSFYEATITGYQSNGDGYVVAYSTLSRRDDGGSPLRELAAAANVRPRPPTCAPPRGFALHEMVEAFHNDGWWAGVVCGVPPLPPPAGAEAERPRRVYTVCFPTSREVLEFEETALRPRRVLRGERWVPAAGAENGVPLFREESQVEVSRCVKSFGKYWSPATVLKVIGATSFLVQYRDIGEDGQLVTEIIDSQYIRPARNIIRMDSKYRFPPSSHAEVFHKGSWWPGDILEILDNEPTKKYVIKIKSHETDMDDVECVNLTVDHTQLRPRYDWYRGKWVRCLTEKVKRKPQSTSRKRFISAALESCNDSVDITASAWASDKTDNPGSYLKENVNSAGVALEPGFPDFLACIGNNRTEQRPSSCPEKIVRQQSTFLAFESHLTLPSQSSVKGFVHLKNDPNLSLSGNLEVSSSRMISMPSVPRTGQLQASLFGAFGQLRPLPQGPHLVMQSLNQDLGSMVGSRKVFTAQEKQSTDKCSYLMAGTKRNFTVGSVFGADLSRKRLKQRVSPQTPVLLGENTEIVLKRKNIADKNVEEASNSVVISEKRTEPNNDDGKEVLDNISTTGSLTLSDIVTCIDSRPLKGDKVSQESSVFLREGCVADEIIPSGVPIEADGLHRQDYIGSLQHDEAEVRVLIEKSVLSITSTLDNSGDTDVFPHDSSTQCGNITSNVDRSTIIIEPDDDEFCQRSLVLLPSAESCEATEHDHQICEDNMEAMVEGATSWVVPTENFSSMSPDMFSGVALKPLPSSENHDANKKDSMGKEDHQVNTGNMPETQYARADGPSLDVYLPALKGDMIVTHGSTTKFAGNEERVVPHQDHSSSMFDFAVEASQSIESSETTQLSSIEMSNSTEAELGYTLTAPKDAEGTPMSKYVPSRTHGSCALLRRSLDALDSIVADRPSESLAVESLPFVKTSPMWAHIEAMEIFRKVPQQPNFHQFQQHVPELREGMALGLMISFANLAESIKRLTIQDDSALFEEKMKGLSSLEADGFDVRQLRSQLETLVHIKNDRAKLEAAINVLEEKIAHKETGYKELNRQIGMLNTTVRQLELQASLFRGIMQSVVSEKMKNASEILTLKTKVSELKRSYLSGGAVLQ